MSDPTTTTETRIPVTAELTAQVRAIVATAQALADNRHAAGEEPDIADAPAAVLRQAARHFEQLGGAERAVARRKSNLGLVSQAAGRDAAATAYYHAANTLREAAAAIQPVRSVTR